MSRYYSIKLNELPNRKVLKRSISALPDYNEGVADIIAYFFAEDKTEGINMIKAYLSAQKKFFNVAGVMVTLEDLSQHTTSFYTYKDPLTGTIVYETAFHVSYEVAVLQYLLDREHDTTFDEATIALMHKNNSLSSLPIGGPTTFGGLSNTMLMCLRGTYDADDDYTPHSLYDLTSADEYLLYLLMPRMDNKFVTLHKQIFEALVSGDTATIKQLITVK